MTKNGLVSVSCTCRRGFHHSDDDRSRGYNRAEHLRQHVKTDDGDSVYDRCYGWREDAESLNNSLDRAPCMAVV